MTTTTEASTEAQAVWLNTEKALNLAARATDLSFVNVSVTSYDIKLAFRRNADAAVFAERIGAHVDEDQNAAGDRSGKRYRWWITDDGVRVTGWGEDL